MRKVLLVAGLLYGDEGKGATVDFLTHRFNAGLVVRYNGGSQAGHNVCLPDGRQHTFAQFGSGMFYPDVKTHLSRFMLINPINMFNEYEHLHELGIHDAWERTTVDEKALIITPFHQELNRVLSWHRGGESNSCGQGIGVCRDFHLAYGDDVLFAGDLKNDEVIRKKLHFIFDRVYECVDKSGYAKRPAEVQIEPLIDDYKTWPVEVVPSSHLRDLLNKTNCAIFEGAQGVLLDETYGEPGFNTWTDTTFNNAFTLLDEACTDHQVTRIGVVRTYATRHGAGPFPTEDPSLCYPEPHNDDAGFQGKFRKGHFDMDAVNRALAICGGVDMIALNHCDRAPKPKFGGLGIPTGIFGFGPTRDDRSMLPF